MLDKIKKYLSENPRTRDLLVFGAISVLFILLRVRNIGHLLMWDEAWNVLSLRAWLAGAVKDPFYWYYRFHPPLYMFFAQLLFPAGRDFAHRAEFLSLLFSYGTLCVTFLYAKRVGGWKYAALAGLFLCCLPASIGYDTWVKRDSLAVFLGYAGLLFLDDDKNIPAAAALGFSLLSKESGLFFIIAAMIMLLIKHKSKRSRLILLYGAMISAISGWWFVFFSTLSGNTFEFYFSDTVYKDIWTRSPFYYLMKMRFDVGIPILLFFIPGLYVLPRYGYSRRKTGIWMPVLVFLTVLVPASVLFSTKTPWLIYSALPAIALIAGGGAVAILRRTEKRAIARALSLLVIAAVLSGGFMFSYEDYFKKSYPEGWNGAKNSAALAFYLNQNMGPEDSLMISGFAYWQMPVCPIFFYYWESHPVLLVKGTEAPDKLVDIALSKGIKWLVIPDSPVPGKALTDTVKGLKTILKVPPVKIGWSYVWDLRKSYKP